MRPVAVVTVARRVVSVNTCVHVEDFAMVRAENAHGGEGCSGFSMLTRAGGRVAEAIVVGIKTAVGNPNDDTRTVQPQRPVGMLVKAARLHQGGSLAVASVRGQHGFNPEHTIGLKQRFKGLEARCMNGQGTG